jgi:hypothetical protein
MNNLIDINVEYSYYSTTRRTPIYVNNEKLLTLNYDDFISLMIHEIPYLGKIQSPLRCCVKDCDDNEIDLSPKYIVHQMNRLLQSGMNTLNVRVFESESPLPSANKTVYKTGSTITRPVEQANANNRPVDRTITLTMPMSTDLPSRILTSTSSKEPPPSNGTVVHLPLERYARKQDKELNRMNDELVLNRSKITAFDGKIRQAYDENGGPLGACGKCHLKLGHTRRNCSFSPCKSAFSCGILTKHADQKVERSNLEKTVKSISAKLTKARRDVEHAKLVMQKVNNNHPKGIESIIMKEFPQRYMSHGLRNWALLNKDVVRLEGKLRGSLPTRESILPLLHEIVSQTETSDDRDEQSEALSSSGSRVLPQKRLLEEQFCIRYPTTKKRSRELFPRYSEPFANDQEEDDFKLAIKLQNEEMSYQCDSEVCDDKVKEVSDESGDDSNDAVNAASALLSLHNTR